MPENKDPVLEAAYRVFSVVIPATVVLTALALGFIVCRLLDLF